MPTIPFRDPHPRHGPHDPSPGTPRRELGSLRRTSTIDILRPDGPDGPLKLRGTARDLRTGRDGAATTMATAAVLAVVDFVGDRRLRALTTAPQRPGLTALLGERVSAGFRGRIDRADPELAERPGPLRLLLDDLPVATLVSGHAWGAARADGRTPLPLSPGRPALVPDLCAGFATGGTIMAAVAETGRPPLVTGPAAPALADPDDPVGWHSSAALPAHAMRRTRRIDVGAGAPAGDGPVRIDALFRDSYVRADGVETVIHEYTVAATAVAGVLTACSARPRVLPWLECPAAAASAGRLVGVPLADLRRHVRETFAGTTTCTHLNDTLRALEDVPSLLAACDRPTGDPRA